MSQPISRLPYLLERYRSATCADLEREALMDLLRDPTLETDIKDRIDAEITRLDSYAPEGTLGVERADRVFDRVLDEIRGAPVVEMPQRKRQRLAWWAAAAILLLLGGGAAYFFFNNRHIEKPNIAAVPYKGDVLPGHNGAVLHLSNGSTVVLDSAHNGTVATQGTLQAVKSGGELKYVGKTSEVLYNTITTDRGRQWQLTLSDGTKVWLNAASSIHYPLAFTGAERVVEITGEAYLEVAHNLQQPFRVKVGNHEIEDIGTAFDVNDYTDEPVMRATLVEGAIKIGGVTLKPGQQATIAKDGVNVTDANIEQVLAWKNGLFSFDRADIYTVMRQISRWYNVEVKFEGQPDNVPFQGEIGRGLTLAQVLKVLEQVHVHFRIEEDKRIIILP